MKIDSNFISDVKSKLDIVDVIGAYINLQKAGINHKGICPFHQDSHPSMMVSKTRQTYHCFVCGEHGDVLDFLQKYNQITFTEALRLACKLAGVEFPEKEATPEENAAYRLLESRRIAIDAAAKFYQGNLSQAESFLRSRGYDSSDKALAEFGVGYAPSGNVAMRKLTEQGYNLQLLTDVGILGKSQDGRSYDFFRDRIMFPFYDISGRVIAFSGRIVTPNDNAGKYVNTGETPIFRKGQHIFGLYQAKKAIARAGFAYLVEGQFDVITLHRYGVENVIGGSGTAFTDDQIRLILRFTQSVVMIYDADDAGMKAAVKNCELLLKAGISVRCVRLPKGYDPDSYGRLCKEELKQKLFDITETFPKALKRMLVPRGCKDEATIASAMNTISNLVACVQDAGLRLEYMKSMAKDFDTKMTILEDKVRDIRRNVNDVKKENMKQGIFGVDSLKENLRNNEPAVITSSIDTFMESYGDNPIVYAAGMPSSTDIQNLRRICCYFVTTEEGCAINSTTGEDSDYLATLAEMYKAGISQIRVMHEDKVESFIDFYIRIHGDLLSGFLGDKVPVITRCIELTSYAEETVITVNKNHYCSKLGLSKGQFDEIRKPFVSKRKNVLKANALKDDLYDDDFDGDEVPSYAREGEYAQMFRECKYYPRLNKQGIPVCYMFQNKNGRGFSQVADFYMVPLLHIFNEDFEQNKRVLKVNRRYFDKPLYIEVLSSSLKKMSTIEDVLINYEGVNFTDGEEWQWRRIKEYMSRHFVQCREIQTYGNQQSEGMSRKTDEQFFAFANGIAHEDENGNYVFEKVNELGVVTHNHMNYYLPAFSTIYAGSGRQSDKYELISQLVYEDIPINKQVTFEQWASLMDKVYKINDNGKWAIVFALMCAFRSNIHCLDRLFTAPFFMGPMSSGKTQIAISIRSLFISPTIPIFNLNTGTDAAMSTIMGTFRDVPVVLDEYNNKDISDTKFQALKGIVYDGDGKQKRRGTSGRDIENDKVFAPVVICGQETPQRDDNALMSRVIICEVPKPKNRTPEETKLFEELKNIEKNIGLSNVLLEVLSLRPAVMDHFRALKQEAYGELKSDVINSGEMDRLMKTASLFLGMVKLVERYSKLKLPFTYDEFFTLVQEKIKFQLSLIRSTDKLAMFFNAVNNMIDTKQILVGREMLIEQPKSVTGKDSHGDKKTFGFDPGTHVLFLRLSSVYSIYDRSGYNSENTTLSILEQNLRSHPSYIGTVPSRRFTWEETVEVAKQDDQETMVRVRKERSTSTSAIIIDYDKFMEMYNIDFRRGESLTADQGNQDTQDTGKDATREQKGEYKPGSIPFDQTDKGKYGNTPF
jgi:DNA primase catalytic core|nr:MAG TPA_asm: DNA primase [Caudoviricetes sp.]